MPDAAQEALRDLVRAREAAKKDQLKARHRLGKFLLRHGRQRPEGIKAWTKKHREWIKSHVRFEASRRWKPRWPITSRKWTTWRHGS